jgi:DNA polymerase IV (DinB-like DNA polymerase)
MNELGIITIRDLAKFYVQKLMTTFGKTLGVYFHNAANGIDDEPVLEAGEAESISRIAALKQDSTDLQFILEKTDPLAAEVHDELMKKGLNFRQIGIIMILTDLTTRSRMQTLEQPTKNLEILKKSVQNLLSKYLETTDKPIRRIGVKVSQLTKEESKQKPLEAFFTR